MNLSLLKQFIRGIVREEHVKDPRIPTQLMSPSDASDGDDTIKNKVASRKDDTLNDDAIDEFSAIGGGNIAGTGGPIAGHFKGIPSKKKKKK